MSEPVSAAAVVILDAAGDEILFVKRNPELRFMGGHHAFVGGRIDVCEGCARVVEAEDVTAATAIHAVAREVFEETGLLLARGEVPSLETLAQDRLAILDGSLAFDAVLDRHGLAIDARDFTPAGRWITPPMSPIRFDTQYYIYRHDGPRYESVVHGEIVGLDWMRPSEARARWRRGEIKLSTPIAYVLAHLARLPFPDVLVPLRRETHREDGLTSRFELRCGVSIIPLVTETIAPATHTNCIVVGEEELVVIDPGAGEKNEQEHLKHQLEHMLDMGATLRAVVLTHSHPDHAAAVPMLQETFGVPLWCHSETARQLGVASNRTIGDGDMIELAGNPPWRLRAIHTPGHDPGHLCFVEETTGSLIAGDMVANPGTIVISREHGGDMSQFLASLERLLDVKCNILFPGHGMPIRKPRDKILEHLEHRLWRESRIQAAVDAGHRDLRSIVAHAYADVPESVWPLAEHTALAHIERLGVKID